MGVDFTVNISDDVAPYGGKSAFTQLEHNIVAGYLITAGKKKKWTKKKEKNKKNKKTKKNERKRTFYSYKVSVMFQYNLFAIVFCSILNRKIATTQLISEY